MLKAWAQSVGYEVRGPPTRLRALPAVSPFSGCVPALPGNGHWCPRGPGCKESLFCCSVGLGSGRRQSCLIHNTSTSCLSHSVLFLPPTPVRHSFPLQDLETSFGEDINTSKGSMSGKEVNSKAGGFPWKRLRVLLLSAAGTAGSTSLPG